MARVANGSQHSETCWCVGSRQLCGGLSCERDVVAVASRLPLLETFINSRLLYGPGDHKFCTSASEIYTIDNFVSSVNSNRVKQISFNGLCEGVVLSNGV